MHLYLHIPFCDGKCHYCAFYSVVRPRAARLAFAGRIVRELDLQHLETTPFETLYIGGGTPGLLEAEGFRLLGRALRERGALARFEEWTVELNPASAGAGLLEALREAGVNRISLGAQSFDDAVLRRMGRRHDAAAVVAAIERVRSAGFENYGLDLIAGLPDVTAPMWLDTLTRAAALGCSHLSVYGLGIEPDTALMAAVRAGRAVPDADAQLDAIAVAESVLSEHGFLRYEISNYARPGLQCRHNLAVWRGADYLGLGPAAASRVGRRRWTNRADLEAWETALLAEQVPPRESEDVLSPADDALERFLFGLRLDEGVSPSEFASRHPVLTDRVREWEGILTRLTIQGMTERVPDAAPRWRLTARGREVADAVMREMI